MKKFEIRVLMQQLRVFKSQIVCDQWVSIPPNVTVLSKYFSSIFLNDRILLLTAILIGDNLFKIYHKEKCNRVLTLEKSYTELRGKSLHLT